jgi:hypothetical protein
MRENGSAEMHGWSSKYQPETSKERNSEPNREHVPEGQGWVIKNKAGRIC